MKRKVQLFMPLFVFLCMMVALFSVTVNAETYTKINGGSSVGTAAAFSTGQSYVTSIQGRYVRHWYKFTTSSEDAYYYLETANINVPSHSWSSSLYAEVCTEYGEVLFKNSHTSNTGVAVSNMKLDPDTTYYLCVHEDWDASSPGNFRFKITKKADPDGNRMSDATVVSLNKKYDRNLSGNGDQDWFSFKTGSGNTYIFYGKNVDVHTHSWASDRYFRLTLFNEVGEVIADHRLTYGSEGETTVTLSPNTIYYIQACNYWEENPYEENDTYLFSIGTPTLTSENVSIEQTSYVYNGKSIKPGVSVVYNNVTLTKGKDYSVTYRNNKNAGTATVSVKGLGTYNGTVNKKFKITKADQKISAKASAWTRVYGSSSFSLGASAKGKLTYSSSKNGVAVVSSNGKVTVRGCGTTTITIKAAATSNYKAASRKVKITVKPKVQSIKVNALGSRRAKISWKKDVKASGYQIQYSLSKKFSSGVTTKVEKSKTSLTVTKLRSNKRYYFRMRAYAKSGNTTLYSDWSPVEYVTIK
ncbi:MAG: fibronectin type III domain-containing protein [Lachnospiraceae bacterium]|nr:fibronectin type III domain-containing protein [Lachnospiraceae bacterium]